MIKVATNSNLTPNAAPASPTTSHVDTKKILLTEIGAKWNKLSEQDLSSLKGSDDLVTQVVAKYGLEKIQAQMAVESLLKGRVI
jgi:hypothetical protein